MIKYKKNTLRLWREYLQQKYQKKKIFYRVLKNIFTAKMAIYIYIYIFLYFLHIKGLNIKMALISAKGYNNAKVQVQLN